MIDVRYRLGIFKTVSMYQTLKAARGYHRFGVYGAAGDLTQFVSTSSNAIKLGKLPLE